jgi:hypothetical protein
MSIKKKLLREAGYIREHGDGWILIDQTEASMMRLIMGSTPK